MFWEVVTATVAALAAVTVATAGNPRDVPQLVQRLTNYNTDAAAAVASRVVGSEDNGESVNRYYQDVEQPESMQLVDLPRARKPKCKTSEPCKKLGGECIPKKDCEVNLNNVEEGCSKKCVCCVPRPTQVNQCMAENNSNSTIWKMMYSAEANIKNDVETHSQRLKDNQEAIKAKLDSIIKFLGVSTTTVIMPSTTETPELSTGCTFDCDGGCITCEGSTVKFRFYYNQWMDWSNALEFCDRAFGFNALPSGEIVANLRSFIIEQYGEGPVWVAGKGYNGVIVNYYTQNEISSTIGWAPRQPGQPITDESCMTMLAIKDLRNAFPTQPYFTFNCTNRAYVLCQDTSPTNVN